MEKHQKAADQGRLSKLPQSLYKFYPNCVVIATVRKQTVLGNSTPFLQTSQWASSFLDGPFQREQSPCQFIKAIEDFVCMFVCFSFKPEKKEMDIFALGPLCSYFAVCNLWKIIKTNIICSFKKPAGIFFKHTWKYGGPCFTEVGHLGEARRYKIEQSILTLIFTESL